jgi:hypothetical protein
MPVSPAPIHQVPISNAGTGGKVVNSSQSEREENLT